MTLNNVLNFIDKASKKFNMFKLYPNNDLSAMHVKLFTDIPGAETDMAFTISSNADRLEIGIGLPYYDDGKVVSVKLENKILLSDNGDIEYFAHPVTEHYTKPTWLQKYEQYGPVDINVCMFDWDKLALSIIEEWRQFINGITR